MAADEEHAADSATMAPPNNGPPAANPADSAAGDNPAAGKRGPAGNKRRGEKGRAEWRYVFLLDELGLPSPTGSN